MDELKTAAQQTDNIVDLFKNEFASTIIPVYIKSLDKVLDFREITVSEQKSLTKTQIENQTKPATVYRAFSRLIESALLTKNVDVYALTEADRYAILFNLYQTAFLDKPQSYKCSQCNSEFNISPDASAINKNFASLDTNDKVYTLQDSARYYIFTCNYPTIKRVTDTLDVFQRKYMSNRHNINDADAELLAIMESVDYVNSFIKSLTIDRLDKSKEPIVANFENMSADHVADTLALLPQHVMLAEDKGITSKLLTDFIAPINDVFSKQKCPTCNIEFQGQMGSISDFLA